MSFGKKILGWLSPTPSVRCPLCGSAETRGTKGEIAYSKLKQKLVAMPEWRAAHAAQGALPDIPAEIRDRVNADPMFPDTEISIEESPHQRCAKCRSLLPPQFWRGGPTQKMAMTVAGAPGHGKTTWLLSVLLPPKNSRYCVIGYSGEMNTRGYAFAEPYTLEMLDAEFRTPVSYLLMGSTIRYRSEQVDVRTLDIMGEQFRTSLDIAAERIRRHLTLGGDRGALLIVERYVRGNTPARVAINIGQAYSTIGDAVRGTLRGGYLWNGVVWTWLDAAEWSSAGEQWLRSRLGADADPFIQIGSDEALLSAQQENIDAYEAITENQFARLKKFLGAIKSTRALSEDELDPLVALLFRMQILYSARASDARTDPLAYFEQGGITYVRACQELARLLYIRWDAPRGGLGTYLRGTDPDFNWKVMACGRILEPGRDPESVWSDQIVLEVMMRSDVRI